MDPTTLPTEVIVTHPRESLGEVRLDWTPQPGNQVDVAGKTYTVLERRHRYHLKAGRYRLHQVALHVQPTERPTEQTKLGDRWVLGDARCRYNAHSELLRCAVQPSGPCAGCHQFELDPHWQSRGDRGPAV
ncbi:MAG: DUF6464 family protein [Cyanobacteria bacterium]|nr:DUF6464 family protein [Cyanobacteriota bacterium]